MTGKVLYEQVNMKDDQIGRDLPLFRGVHKYEAGVRSLCTEHKVRYLLCIKLVHVLFIFGGGDDR